MTWRVARSLDTLLHQLNVAFPNRDKSSDGAIGDADHASRSSDHNPWVRDGKGQPIVTARDFTHDPKTGVDGERLLANLIASKDKRIKYIIWNRHIYSGTEQEHAAWMERPYNGKNPHNHHIHISVKDRESLFDDATPWRLTLEQSPAERAVTPTPPPHAQVRLGSKGVDVRKLQELLKIPVDGWFGSKTLKAVKEFQTAHNLPADGIVGRYTWGVLEPERS